MKAYYLSFLLLLVAAIVHAQYIVQDNQPVAIQSPYTNNATTDYECIPPTDFDAHVYSIGYDEYMLYLTWDMQSVYGEWFHWDDGLHFSGVGSCPDMTAAAKWDNSHLADYHNFRLKKMRIIMNDLSADTIIFKVWNGMDDNYLIYQDTLLDYDDGVWITHDFKTDLFIDSSNVLLIGYSALSIPGGNFPLGTDKGPGVPGYGDLIRTDHDLDWDSLSMYGLDYNWNIQFYVEDTTGNQMRVVKSSGERNMNFIGYNLYHSTNEGDFELLEFIPSENDSNYYALPLDASPDLHCYQLTSLWFNQNDTCESAPAISSDDPAADSVCVLLVSKYGNNANKDIWVQCLPNPFTTSTNIEYTLSKPQAVTIIFYNQFGKQVDWMEQKQSFGPQNVTWAPDLPPGIYYFTLQAGEQVSSGKVIKMQ